MFRFENHGRDFFRWEQEIFVNEILVGLKRRHFEKDAEAGFRIRGTGTTESVNKFALFAILFEDFLRFEIWIRDLRFLDLNFQSRNECI